MKQRIIKFRAFVKDDPNGDMQEVLLLDPIGQVVKLTDYGALAFKEVEIMQFTGLLDKNGKEIYESDILQDAFGVKAVCEFGTMVPMAMSGFYMKSLSKEPGFHAFENSWLEKQAEVIGNIYENPNLLNN